MDTHTINKTSAMLDGIARLVIAGGVALLPFFVLPLPWMAVSQSKMLLVVSVVIVAGILWAAARLFEGAVHLPRGALLYAGLFLVIAYALSAGFAGFPTNSLVGQGIEQDTLAAVIVLYAAFALTSVLFVGHTAALRMLVHAFAIGLTALFAYQMLYLFVPAAGFGLLTSPTNNILGSWHDLGILAGLGLFMAAALFRSGIFIGYWRYLLVALGALALFLLFIIHFNDVFWGTAALCFLGWMAAMRSNMQSDSLSFKDAALRPIALLVLSVVLALSALFGTSVWDKFPESIRISEIEVRPSWQGTFDVGRQSLGAPASLLFGTGPNSFIREWGMHKPVGVNSTPFWNTDFNFGVGIIPTSVFTAGIVGTLAWASLIFIVLGLMLRFVREVRPLSTGRTLFGFLLVASAYAILFHMIYTPGVGLSAITFILLGMLAVVVAGDRQPRTLSTASVKGATLFAVVVLLAVPAAFAAGLIGREIASNALVNKASVSFNQSGSVSDAHAAISSALAVSPRNDRAHRAAAELGLVEFMQGVSTGTDTDEARAQLQQTLQTTIQHGLTAISIDDANYQNWLVLAQVYGSLADGSVEGAYEQAKENYQRAFDANPNNPVPKLRLAQLAIARNEIAEARTLLTDAITLKPDFAAAIFLLSQVEAADGKGDAAVQAAATAVQLVPDDPLGWFNLGYILYVGGSYQDAAASLEQAIMRATDYSNAVFFLGMSYYQLGRPDDAISAFQRVLELNPSEAWLQKGIEDIRAGVTPFAETPAEE